jgi:hypothetical protein
MSQKQNAILILSGVHTEYQSLDLLPVFSLDYQIPNHQDDTKTVIETLARIPEIQQQIVSAYLWIASQDEMDKNKISVIAISFGSFMAPSTLRALSLLGHTPYTTSFLVTPYLLMIPEVLSYLIIHHLKNLNPSQHLPFLKGPFFVLNGLYDEVIPKESIEKLVNELPDPKKVQWIPTPHIKLQRPKVIQISVEQTV